MIYLAPENKVPVFLFFYLLYTVKRTITLINYMKPIVSFKKQAKSEYNYQEIISSGFYIF